MSEALMRGPVCPPPRWVGASVGRCQVQTDWHGHGQTRTHRPVWRTGGEWMREGGKEGQGGSAVAPLMQGMTS